PCRASPPRISALALHDALPILGSPHPQWANADPVASRRLRVAQVTPAVAAGNALPASGLQADWELAVCEDRRFAAGSRKTYGTIDRKSTRLNSSHVKTSYSVLC